MEREWELARLQVSQLRGDHPEWTLKVLAQHSGPCLSWVKKWLRRFREVDKPSLAMFKSRSRAPHHRPRQVVAAVHLSDFRHFYNHERAHQALACGNRPPYHAFPVLPKRPILPEWVDPEAWLSHYHRRVFKRRVGQNGQISVGSHLYSVGYAHARQGVEVLLDAQQRVFNILHRGTVLRQLEIQGLVGHPMPFADYLKHMLAEARTLPA